MASSNAASAHASAAAAAGASSASSAAAGSVGGQALTAQLKRENDALLKSLHRAEKLLVTQTKQLEVERERRNKLVTDHSNLSEMFKKLRLEQYRSVSLSLCGCPFHSHHLLWFCCFRRHQPMHDTACKWR